tara:strand:+ start:748 stop:918 length:171 start_codon:yes stop_codon:yes gene_type:complete
MAKRKVEVVVSKKSEVEIRKGLREIEEKGARITGLELGSKVVDGVSVSILRVLLEV